MKATLLSLLACPDCGAEFRLHDAQSIDGDIVTGTLQCAGCGTKAPIKGGVPRFTSDDYASSFSFEWNRFSTTQLDSARQSEVSERRLEQNLTYPLDELAGKLVLDVGCGMGRFAEVVAKHGGTVVGADISYAVDAAAKNLARWPNAHVIQADLRRLPLRERQFDLVYSLGVLHHTPDPRKSFEGLIRYVTSGGQISITLYSGYNRVYVGSTNAWRHLTTRLPRELMYALSYLAVPLYYVYRIPLIGLLGRIIWPISLDPDWRVRVLDTFDCYTPQYQFFHSHPDVYRWFSGAKLCDIAVLEPGISFIGRLPADAPRPELRAVRPSVDAVQVGERA